MGEQFANPPLLEAVFEIRLAPAIEWTAQKSGELADSLSVDFPTREVTSRPLIVVGVGSDGEPNPKVSSQDMTRCYSTQRNRFVLIQERAISVHTIKPYLSWDVFRPMILGVIEKTKGVFGSGRPARLGLRYVNLIAFPSAELKLEDYLQVGILLGKALPQQLAHFLAQAVFSYEQGRDFCRLTVSPATPGSANNGAALNLDIDYFTAVEQSISVDDIGSWIESAHARIEELFLGSVTEKLKLSFNGRPT